MHKGVNSLPLCPSQRASSADTHSAPLPRVALHRHQRRFLFRLFHSRACSSTLPSLQNSPLSPLIPVKIPYVLKHYWQNVTNCWRWVEILNASVAFNKFKHFNKMYTYLSQLRLPDLGGGKSKISSQIWISDSQQNIFNISEPHAIFQIYLC